MKLLPAIVELLWNGPILILLMATHLFLTIRLGFPQKKTLKAVRMSLSTDSDTSQGLSGFATLATTLAATLGTGNIVGISTAIAYGGPGALFWCFLTGLLGMATVYGECFLSLLYRRKKADGTYTGGPMYVLKDGLHKPILAAFYALCVIGAAMGVGCTTQANAISDTLHSTFLLSPYLTGMAAALIAGMVIVGGVTSISRFCTRIVPALSLLYMGCCIYLLVYNFSYLDDTVLLIMKSAFTSRAAGGGFIGSTFLLSARFGIARGLFTNEAGIGTTALAAGSSGIHSIKRQSLISMTAVFWDTIVMCTLTGLVIVSCLLRNPSSAVGYTVSGLTSAAFSYLPLFGEELLSLILTTFAIATLIGWCYLGEKGVVYLFGPTGIHSYQLFYIVMIFVGAIAPLQLVWDITDLINAIMIFPNVFALFALHKKLEPPGKF